MSVIDGLIHRLNVWRGRATYEHDIEDEMRFHIALDAEHQAARHGSDAASATSAARRRFGNLGYFKEETRQAAGLHVLDGAVHDGRHLVRSLLRAPGFTTVVVLTLALGIGATTAVLSIVDHILLHSLPFRDPNRLVMMYERDDHGANLDVIRRHIREYVERESNGAGKGSSSSGSSSKPAWARRGRIGHSQR